MKGKWAYTAKRMLNKWENYLKDLEDAEAEFPTPRGAVKYNKKRTPHMGHFVNRYLKISRGTFEKYASKEFVEKYERTPNNKSYDGAMLQRAIDLHNAAVFIKEECLSMIEYRLMNGEGHAAGTIHVLKTNWGKDPARMIEKSNDQSIEIKIIDGRKDTGRDESDISSTDQGV